MKSAAGHATTHRAAEQAILIVMQEAGLAIGDDRIGIFAPAAGEYVELTLEGRVAGRWPAPELPATVQLGRCAMTGDGNFYVSLETGDDSRGTYVLRKDGGSFERVTLSGRAASGLMFGSSGNRLVLETDANRAVWYAPSGASLESKRR